VPVFVGVALVLGVSGSAHADPPRSGVRLDGLQPASAESTFFRAEGPHEKKAGTSEIGLSLGVDFAEAPLRAVIVNEDGTTGEERKVVERALMMRVGASLSPAYWVWMDLQAPFALFEQSGITEGDRWVFAGQTVRAPVAPGLGDLRAGLHFRPIDTEAFDLIVGARYWAPVGSIDAYMSDGQFRAELDLGAAGRVGKVLYGCTLAVAPGFFAPRDGDRIALSCGVHGQVMSFLSLGLEPAFAVYRDRRLAEDLQTGGKRTFDAVTFQIEPLAAVRLNTGGFSVALAGGPGFGDAPGTPQGRLMLQLAYQFDGKPKAPPPPPGKPTDLDLDGIPNDGDACPEQAGPQNQDAKLHGCPIQDSDGDLIRDEDDACPIKAGITHADVKANGCPDSDNDLLPDPVDSCRNEPGDEKASGCPVYARLDKKGFLVNPPIAFADGSSVLSKQAKAALAEIAATMRANPKLGHVSIALGTKGASGVVSDKRAEQISLVLLGANVDSQRFEVVLQDSLRSGVVEIRLVK
jgi:OOP family OmpA-OmpF porin